MKTQTVSLKSSEMSEILANGGKITFKPLHRGQFKCNQAPRLTGLSNGQISALRGQVNALSDYHTNSTRVGCVKSNQTKSAQAQNYPSVPIDSEGDAKCPHCHIWSFGVRPGVAKQCRYCSGFFIPVSR